MNGTEVIGFVSVEFALGAVRIGVFSLCLGLCSSIVAVPFMVSKRLRGLFDAVGPVGSWVGSYVFWVTVIGGGEIAVFAVTADLIAVQYADPVVVKQLTATASAVLVVGFVLVLCLLALVLLPWLGLLDHQPDRRTVAVVTGVVLWYHIVTVLLSPYAFDWLLALSGWV